MMDRLWSPWRLPYVTGAHPVDGCILCRAAAPARDPAENALVLIRGRVSYVILNLYPYTNGHLMVVPNRHVASLSGLDEGELQELMQFTRDGEVALAEVYQAQGINVGINLGRAAGAGVLDHVHIHLVPRWVGDTNFMSVVGDTRVLPEDLGATAERLRPAFERLRDDR